MEVYGQKDPPIYDIKNIDCPIVTYWSDNDWLAEPTVRKICFELFRTFKTCKNIFSLRYIYE